MKFIYAQDDPELARRNPAGNRIFVLGLGTVQAFYEDQGEDWPPALRIPGLGKDDEMASRQLLHDIEKSFCQQLGYAHNPSAFTLLSFADLITLTREVAKAQEADRLERNIQPQGLFTSQEPRRKLSSRAYHQQRELEAQRNENPR